MIEQRRLAGKCLRCGRIGHAATWCQQEQSTSNAGYMATVEEVEDEEDSGLYKEEVQGEQTEEDF